MSAQISDAIDYARVTVHAGGHIYDVELRPDEDHPLTGEIGLEVEVADRPPEGGWKTVTAGGRRCADIKLAGPASWTRKALPRRTTLDEDIIAGSDRVAAFLAEALADGPSPRPDWRAAVRDAVADLERIDRDWQHPDAVMWARLAAGSLAKMWLDGDEYEAVYTGDG